MGPVLIRNFKGRTLGGSGSGSISWGSSSSSSGSVSASGSVSETGSGSGSGSGSGDGGRGGVCCFDVKNLFGFATGTDCSSCGSTRFCGGRLLDIGSEGLIGITVPSWLSSFSFSSSSSWACCAGANRDLKNLLVLRGGHFAPVEEEDVDEPFAPLSEVNEALPHFLTTPAALTAPENVSI